MRRIVLRSATTVTVLVLLLGYSTSTSSRMTSGTRRGPVQVASTVDGGRVTGVDVGEHPQDNGRDREISARAAGL